MHQCAAGGTCGHVLAPMLEPLSQDHEGKRGLYESARLTLL